MISAARIVEYCRVTLQLSQEEIIQAVIMARSLVECQRSADKQILPQEARPH